MPTDTSTGELKKNRVKLGAVVLLALVFGYVLLKPGGKSPSTAAGSPRAAGPRNAKSRIVEKSAAISTRPLPKIPVAEIERYNPFEFDGQSRRENKNERPTKTRSVADSKANREKRLAEQRLRASLTGQFADIILKSSRGRSARIGPHIVRQGNQIGDGVKVQRIGDSSVILQFQRLPAGGKKP